MFNYILALQHIYSQWVEVTKQSKLLWPANQYSLTISTMFCRTLILSGFICITYWFYSIVGFATTLGKIKWKLIKFVLSTRHNPIEKKVWENSLWLFSHMQHRFTNASVRWENHNMVEQVKRAKEILKKIWIEVIRKDIKC